MKVHYLTFNPFAENTFILEDQTGVCAVIDPGCSNQSERNQLDKLIADLNLKPVLLANTHAHVDHVYGINHVATKYNLSLHIHRGEERLLDLAPDIGLMYGVSLDPIDVARIFVDEGEKLEFGSTVLEILLTPGHSPASICLYHRESGQLIAGDVLFQGSIGRTDLPGGDYDTLIGSITDKLLPLGDEVTVYPGHGPKTTIGVERRTNPFLTQLA